MDKKRVLFYLFVGFLLTRWFYSGVFSLIYTLIIFLTPLIVLIKKRDFHLFTFNVTDTIPSIVINVGYSLGFALLLFIIGFAIQEFNFVMFYSLETITLLQVLFISFSQEILFRYFVQAKLIEYTDKWRGIGLTSLISALVNFPPLSMSLTFLFMSLIIGWVFENTKDIYGATIAHFLIQTTALVML